MTILFVEDDYLQRILFGEYLKDAGFKIVSATHAAEALEIGAQLDVRLLITDISLPQGLDGIALAAAMRRQNAALPVIYVSGHTRQKFGSRIAAADQFLAKPFLPRDLLDTIRLAQPSKVRRAA